jgi:hypothetical protein
MNKITFFAERVLEGRTVHEPIRTTPSTVSRHTCVPTVLIATRRHQYPLASDWHSARSDAVEFVFAEIAAGGDARVGMALATQPALAASAGLPHMDMSPERYLNLQDFVSKTTSAELYGKRVLTLTKPKLPCADTSKRGSDKGLAP